MPKIFLARFAAALPIARRPAHGAHPRIRASPAAMLRAATMLGATAMNCGGAAMTAAVVTMLTAAAMLAAAITCRHASRSFAAAALSRRQMRLARSALRSPRGSTQHCESEVLTCNAAERTSLLVSSLLGSR